MKRILAWTLPGLAVLLVDRAVKVSLGSVNAPLIPGVIRLTSAWNTGMALGLFQGKAPWILLVSIALVCVCLYLIKDFRIRGLAPIALSMIAGGALGNMIDRVFLGYVIDMFELEFMDFYIFNVADAGVVTGAVLCGISLLFRPQDWSRKQ
ncbi:MAG: signal peptidase II [Clostridia bacterium]|nr:signal peptidase II [Clostridia bacterium]